MAIEIRGLSKDYRGGVHALHDVTLDVPYGMFGLLGPNGAGKTTLMRILAGILRPSGGTVRVDDADVSSERGLRKIKRELGYLPQELGLYPDLTAREFLDYVAILKGLDDRKRRRQRVEELLDIVALTDAAGRKLKTYSGGMKRRVGIAQALLNDPRLLIVDEPTAGLDPEERIRFRNLLAERASDNRTVLLSTHIVEDVSQTCQRLAIIREGRMLFQGAVSDVVRAAQGKVWTLTLPLGLKPEGDAAIISSMRDGDATRYRVVAETLPQGVQGHMVAAEPGVEEGYMVIMREKNALL